MTSKSEVMRAIVAGKMREVFSHESLGCFDVTELRRLVALHGAPLHKCSYSDMHAPGDADPFSFIVGNREVDYERCSELTDEQLEEPLIMLLVPPNVVGEPHETHLMVHRFVERKRRGKEFFMLHLIPLDLAPKVDKNFYRNIPWGKKELIPGVGLVDMIDGENF